MDIEHYLRDMKEKYPHLEIIQEEDGYRLQGDFVLNHSFNDIRMTGNFKLQLFIPNNYPLGFPEVRELSQCIDKNYPHLYENGQLCLASNIELRLYLSQNADIYQFVENYIIPYLYTYKYYDNYGVYPFGERSHGIDGDVEYLKELFNVSEQEQVINILFFIVRYNYRGHLLCPCGSNKKVRNCHGNIFKKVINANLQNYLTKILLQIFDNKENAQYGKYD